MTLPTLEEFVAAEGSTFMVHFTDLSIPLDLVEVLPLPTPTNVKHLPDLVRKVPYQLTFRGPGETPLPQETYRLTHQTLGEVDLFVVPLNVDEEGMLYSVMVN